MLEHLSLTLLILLFVAAAAIVWIAGIHLSKTTDILSTRWGLGEALGGLIMLAIVTNLPEIAITVSGAISGNLSIVTGNLLGGIAIQTVVLVLLDAFGVGRKNALTYQAASLGLVLEALLVIAVLTLTIMGAQLPESFSFGGLAPAGILIAFLWMMGIWLIGKSQNSLPWQEQGDAPYGQKESKGHSLHKKVEKAKMKNISTAHTLTVFIVCALATLVCGVLLEETGSAIANDVGMNGIVFGAVVLAAATSIPELSTGLESVKMGDYKLAVSDIFGGNAFLPVLFLLATIISGHAVLPHAGKTDIYLTALGMLLTAIYAAGLIFRPKKQIARMGVDSFIVLIVYVVGILGLLAIAGN